MADGAVDLSLCMIVWHIITGTMTAYLALPDPLRSMQQKPDREEQSEMKTVLINMPQLLFD